MESEIAGTSNSEVTYLIPPIKSDSDKNEYRVVKLKNGLTALLISDGSVASQQDANSCAKDKKNEEEKIGDVLSYASMSIGAGTYQNPEEFPGLAHFLEHIWFKGSEKYPVEDYYESQIASHNGSQNASTTNEITTYYFSVNRDHFSHCLDIFANLFLAPKFSLQYIPTVRDAINSEFEALKIKEVWQYFSFMRSLAEEGSNVKIFGEGNLLSLGGNAGEQQEIKDVELQKAIFKFWRRYYISSCMRLVVQSCHTLDELERMVVENFSSIKESHDDEDQTEVPHEESLNLGEQTSTVTDSVLTEAKSDELEESLGTLSLNSELNGYSNDSPENGDSDPKNLIEEASNNSILKYDSDSYFGKTPFDTPEFNKIYHVSNILEKNKLCLSFALPPVSKYYKALPEKQVEEILNFRGNGSLYKELLNRMWATNLECADILNNSTVYLIVMSFDLTEEGVHHIYEIIDIVFSYIKMMQQNLPHERIFKEKQILMAQKFKYEKTSSEYYAPELSENMIKCPSEHYICIRKLLLEYDPNLISKFLAYLTPRRMNIVLLKKNSTIIFDRIEKWYGTKYAVEDLTDELLERWSQVEVIPEFFLPPSNDYLMDNFTLLPCDDCSEPDAPPELLLCDEFAELWYKQDTRFKVPKMHLNFSFISPLVSESVYNQSAIIMLNVILQQLIAEDVNFANSAGLNVSIDIADYGLEITFNGFNHKLPVFVKNILKHMLGVEIVLKNTPGAFEVARNYATEMLNQHLLTNTQSDFMLLALIKNKSWSFVECLSALTEMTVDDIIYVFRKLKSRMYVKTLMQGNLSKEQAIDILEIVKNEIKYEPLLPMSWPQFRVAQVEVGSRVLRVASLNPKSPNSIVAHHFFCGPEDARNACIDIIMPLLDQAAFDTLRSKESLGYTVEALKKNLRGIQYFHVLVKNQQDKNSCDHVDARIWEFMRQFEQKLILLSDTELEEMKKILVQKLLQCDLTLQNEVERNWKEITNEEYLFNRNKIKAAAMSKVTKEELLEWYRFHILRLNSTARHLSLQLQGFVELAEGLDATGESVNENEIKQENQPDTTDSASCSRPQFLKVLIPALLEDSVSKPILNIENYKNSLFMYPVISKRQDN